MSRRFCPHAVTPGALLNTPPRRSQLRTDGRHAAPSHALWIHRAVGAEPEDVEPVLAPRRDGDWTREDAAEPFPVERRRPPRGSVPRLVVHRAISAESEDIEPVLSPRRDDGRAGEDAAEPFPIER